MPPRRQGLKMAVVGESAAGKTAFITRLLHSHFAEGRHKPTDGCYRHNTTVKLDDGRKLPLQLWDTPGKATFQDIAQNFEPSPISGADGLIVVYDGSSSRSASSLKKWVKAVRKAAPPGCRGVLIGTKLDRVGGGKVPPCRAKAVALAKANGMRHAEVSAADEDSVGVALGKFIELVVGGEARQKRRQQLPPNVPSDQMVQVWLEHEGLGDYAEAFAAAGYKGAGCLAELQALERQQLLLLCKRVHGEQPGPRPAAGKHSETGQGGGALASRQPLATSGRAAAVQRPSQDSAATAKTPDREALPALSVPELLASRGLAVYAPLFASAGYSGAACAVELAELGPGQLEKLCRSLEEPLASAAGPTNPELRLQESDCVDLAAWLSVRGPYRASDALSRLRVALMPSNPHFDDNAKTVAKSGVIAPLVALFLTGVTSPGRDDGRRGKVGPGGTVLLIAEAALDVCAELSRSAE